jgi:hypothetical protein
MIIDTTKKIIKQDAKVFHQKNHDKKYVPRVNVDSVTESDVKQDNLVEYITKPKSPSPNKPQSPSQIKDDVNYHSKLKQKLQHAKSFNNEYDQQFYAYAHDDYEELYDGMLQVSANELNPSYEPAHHRRHSLKSKSSIRSSSGTVKHITLAYKNPNSHEDERFTPIFSNLNSLPADLTLDDIRWCEIDPSDPNSYPKPINLSPTNDMKTQALVKEWQDNRTSQSTDVVNIANQESQALSSFVKEGQNENIIDAKNGRGTGAQPVESSSIATVAYGNLTVNTEKHTEDTTNLTACRENVSAPPENLSPKRGLSFSRSPSFTLHRRENSITRSSPLMVHLQRLQSSSDLHTNLKKSPSIKRAMSNTFKPFELSVHEEIDLARYDMNEKNIRPHSPSDISKTPIPGLPNVRDIFRPRRINLKEMTFNAMVKILPDINHTNEIKTLSNTNSVNIDDHSQISKRKSICIVI